jgi:hypothetical protein
MKENDLELLKYFYFNRKQINDFTYNEEEVIEINSEIIQNKYIDYFYLSLLIEDNINIVNYEYTLDFIKEINDQIKGNNNDCLRELMMSKILLVLIRNYKGTEEYDYNKNEIDELEKFNLERIESNIRKLKEFELNLNKEDIIKKKIDEIYVGIIMDLIKKNKIDDIKYTNNIMMQLDLENINITKTMYDGLANILKSENNYMKKYIISNRDDLYNNDIINFYYILFKYILKKPIYIYQIQFFDKIRKNIFTIIKTGIEKYGNENLEYIVNFFTDSYYTVLLKMLDIKKVKSNSKYDDTSTEVKSQMPSTVQTTVSSRDNNNDNDNYNEYNYYEKKGDESDNDFDNDPYGNKNENKNNNENKNDLENDNYQLDIDSLAEANSLKNQNLEEENDQEEYMPKLKEGTNKEIDNNFEDDNNNNFNLNNQGPRPTFKDMTTKKVNEPIDQVNTFLEANLEKWNCVADYAP